MKQTMKNMSARAFLLFFALVSGAYAMAQDASTSQTESHAAVSHFESTAQVPVMWYTNPIVWVVGGAILLIIIILAVRSGGGTTVIRDGGVSRRTTTTVTKE